MYVCAGVYVRVGVFERGVSVCDGVYVRGVGVFQCVCVYVYVCVTMSV